MTTGTVNKRKIAAFVALAYLLAWSLGFAFFAFGGKLNSAGFVAMGVAYMFTPAIAAIATQLIWRQPLAHLGFHRPKLRWVFIGWLLPVGLMIATIGVGLLLPGIHLVSGLDGLFAQLAGNLSPAQLAEAHRKLDHSVLAQPGVLLSFSFVQVLVAGLSINAAVALGEELGWRGFLVYELRHAGFWTSSLLVGMAWGLWHLPLIINGYNYPGHPVAGPMMMTAMTIVLSPLIGYVRLRGQSIVPAAVFHGTFNAAATLVLFVGGGTPLTVGFTGAAGLFTLLCADVVLWLGIRGREREQIL
jgi:membrane protease YdiL (CAAX protease family)